MSLRQVLALTVLFLAGLPVAAQAQLPGPVPTLTIPTLTTPTLPAPTLTTPTLPAPTPTTPTVPTATVSTPTVSTPTVPTPTGTTAPSLPAPPPAPPTPSPGASTPGTPVAAPVQPAVPVTGTATLVPPGTSGANASTPEPRAGERSRHQRPLRGSSITFGFRVAAAGTVRIPLTQVSPVCRDAGLLVLRAVRGANRVRYDGRAGSRSLPDGTYVAETPSGDVRFAIVRGKPTRKREAFAPSVCAQPGLLLDGIRSLVGAGSSSAPPPPPAAESGGDGADTAGGGLDALPRVLGTSVAEAAEAATSLHPALYVLLALAIAALATATLPGHALPASAAGAALARRRAELTVGGTLALLTVIVAYWFALL